MHKKQLSEGSNLRAKKAKKERTGEKLFMTRRRPVDVSFTAMSLFLILGMFGAHCFFVGRKIRGWIIAIFFIIGSSGYFIPQDWRQAYSDSINIAYFPFVTDIFLIAAVTMWIFDIFAVVFGFFAYPIRLGDKQHDEKKTK